MGTRSPASVQAHLKGLQITTNTSRRLPCPNKNTPWQIVVQRINKTRSLRGKMSFFSHRRHQSALRTIRQLLCLSAVRQIPSGRQGPRDTVDRSVGIARSATSSPTHPLEQASTSRCSRAQTWFSRKALLDSSSSISPRRKKLTNNKRAR